MNASDILARAWLMPLTNRSYPRRPWRFIDREFLVIACHTEIEALRAVVPAPLQVTEPVMKFEFILMPDSTSFGDHAEADQVIPVRFQGQTGGYVHAMHLNEEAPRFLSKIMPHVDCTPRICELGRHCLADLTIKGAWEGPAALGLYAHVLAPVADLPVREVLATVHIRADLAPGLGDVIHDHLSEREHT